ncbi:MAG: ribonuclease J [Rickettsiales bacterium]|nr:ribonuclease J [Rickettsiales bacterium]
MSFNIKKHKDDLLFIPLGGAGEIGMNVNLYHLDGKWIIADLGAGFADDWLPGVDMIVADISFIREHRDDVLGIVLTHAHEDHLGGIQYLWDELECPVYATPFTASFLERKLADSGYKKGEVPIHRIEPGSRFNLGPFDMELVEITHSVPEMNGIFIRTRHGNILHTGDWKLDPKPVVGADTNEAKLTAFGDEGVLAMVSDSTNIFSAGRSGSEGKLSESLEQLIASCKQMIAVTTFASNVARLESLAKAAQKAGRKVALAGRSLYRIKEAAQENGYLTDVKFISIDEAARAPRDKVMIICTGCQGEPLAATNKLATGTHPQLKLLPGDTIIFSSKIIPGNEKRIYRLFNLLSQMQVNVMTEKDHFVHVSGHPNVEDVKRMYEMVRPQVSIPVHGEIVHMKEHARLARKWGIPKAIELENGKVIQLSEENTEAVSVVNSGYFALDGNCLLEPDGYVMKMRRRIRNDGVVVATVIVDDNYYLKTEPIISAPGILDENEDDDLFQQLISDMVLNYDDSRKKSKKFGKSTIENLVRSSIRRVMKSDIGKNPPIHVKIRVVK